MTEVINLAKGGLIGLYLEVIVCDAKLRKDNYLSYLKDIIRLTQKFWENLWPVPLIFAEFFNFSLFLLF